MANQILTISIFRVMCPLERRTPKILLGVYIPKFHRCREILIRTCIIIDFFHDTDELARILVLAHSITGSVNGGT